MINHLNPANSERTSWASAAQVDEEEKGVAFLSVVAVRVEVVVVAKKGVVVLVVVVIKIAKR